ncbi:phospholipase D family protein [Pseudomonas synxantha]|uniref:Uncharacterized protein n=1 Tax=Pseudomonas synxantha TaxID=47883 RepID=A0ACC6JS47_9PSED|nr:phospholipase D family protein [Pseudomonas synxantha]MDR6609029.1 hypothetical protein [Pseudomonas synxantha]
MINQDQRSMLVDALTPPPDHTFENGIVTTFSLDLVTLLSVPLNLCWLANPKTRIADIDPLATLEAMRRTASKLTVFCQPGRLQPPRVVSPLFVLLEDMVYEAVALHGGAFHPKVWLLKFTPNVTGMPAVLRLLVLSRNLTDDASWDLSLRLDGRVSKKRNTQNKPLVSFINSLSELSIRKVPAARTDNLQTLASDAHHAEWELPDAFERLNFHALGLGKKPTIWIPRPAPNERWDELGIISPFVTAPAIEALTKSTDSTTFLISRPEELDRLPNKNSAYFGEDWVLNDQVDSAEDTDELPGRQQGLHAKLFVGRKAWNTHVFLGSANATSAALLAGLNVEFMVELIGRHSRVGIPSNWTSEVGIGDIISPYQRSSIDESDETLQIRAYLDELRQLISAAELRLTCTQQEDGWVLWLAGVEKIDFGQVEVSCWPISITQARAISLSATNRQPLMKIGSFALEDLTSFLAFNLKIEGQQQSFVLNLVMHNAPHNRDIEVLRAALKKPGGFVRYLLLLLGDWDPGSRTYDGDGGSQWQINPAAGDAPLFEMLARAFAREPDRLAVIAELMRRLRKDLSMDGESAIPNDFEIIWKPFEQALAHRGKRKA